MTVLFCFMLPVCLLLLLPLAYLEMGGRWKGLLPVTLCAPSCSRTDGLPSSRNVAAWASSAKPSSGPWCGRAVPSRTRGRAVRAGCCAARIQVYGSRGRVPRGWFIVASGGAFKLHVTEDDLLEVFTIRGNRRLVYAADGTLLGDGQYREDYDRLPTGPACRVDRMSPWYLWPHGQPVSGHAAGLAGLAGLGSALRQCHVADRSSMPRRPFPSSGERWCLPMISASSRSPST